MRINLNGGDPGRWMVNLSCHLSKYGSTILHKYLLISF